MSKADEKKNLLRIESPQFSLELEGDPEFVMETYDTVRRDILKRLLDIIMASQEPAPTVVSPVLSSVEPAAPADLSESQAYVWVYVTHEIYNKVYVVDHPTFSASPLSRFLDGIRLRRIYLSREHRELLGPMVGTGKSLWSELTRKGREQLARGEDG